MSNPLAANRRRHYRVDFFTQAYLVDANGRLPCQVHDVSLKGALVAIPDGSLGSMEMPVTLEIHLADDEQVIRMEISVAHEREGVYGLHCARIDLDSMTHLRRLVELNMGNTDLLERELQHLGD